MSLNNGVAQKPVGEGSSHSWIHSHQCHQSYEVSKSTFLNLVLNSPITPFGGATALILHKYTGTLMTWDALQGVHLTGYRMPYVHEVFEGKRIDVLQTRLGYILKSKYKIS